MSPDEEREQYRVKINNLTLENEKNKKTIGTLVERLNLMEDLAERLAITLDAIRKGAGMHQDLLPILEEAREAELID